ncbi:hypothetical protein FRC09_010381 [Ceratobasidium sp. 395]|nr:hypothetical protein FRC09_010381 [Ceratobasidium sp. 395]
MTAAYYGEKGNQDHRFKNAELRSAIGRAMEFWFANDFSTLGNGACMDGGGAKGDSCPCGTPGLWNTNWFSNVILIPKNVGQVCLLLRDELTPTEYGNCTLITARAYTPFFRNPPPGYVSGANIIDIASIGVSAGLLENNRTGNATRVMDAYRRVHDEITIHLEGRVDGIKPDGSFQQHSGIIYDELELQAVDTPFQANQTTRDTFGRHIGGAHWMTFANTVTGVVHWDMTVIGRMISWPVVDGQASANLRMNLSQVLSLSQSWNQSELVRFGTNLAAPNPQTVNLGNLNGVRMFWNSDYMVYRTESAITTIKMLSRRTATSECVNGQNTKGFHLSDGAMYTYTTGAEYEDIYATFDFSLVPGTTTDYGNTPLDCRTTQQYGVNTYAGGVSTGDVGVAAMRYVNPLTGALSFNKAYFFLGGDVQHVLVNNIGSTSSAPVFSVLDQRLRNGNIYLNDNSGIDSGNYSDVTKLWHAGIGYTFPPGQATQVSVDAENRQGDWAALGASKQPLSTKEIFSAWIVHPSENIAAPVEYSVFPATKSYEDFSNQASNRTSHTVENTDIVSAVVNSTRRTLGAAFWKTEGGSVSVPHLGLVLYVDRPLVLVLKLTGLKSFSGELSISDPTHESTTANVRIVQTSRASRRQERGYIGLNHRSSRSRHSRSNRSEIDLVIELPTEGMAGSTVVQEFGQSY